MASDLAEELEAALAAAIAAETPEDSPATPDVAAPSEEASAPVIPEAVDDPISHLPARALAAEPGEYQSMIKSYGPFPFLLPAHRDFRPVLIISVFFGLLGADRFYEGKHITGALKLVTAGGLGIWWIADIIAILAGRAEDSRGHHFEGTKRDRTIAWILTGVLFAGLGAGAASAAAPALQPAAAAVSAALFPTPAPVPVWEQIADASGAAEPVALTVTGTTLRFAYDFSRPVYAYLKKEGAEGVPGESLLLQENPARGEKEVEVEPGTYTLVVRTDGTAWTLIVEELAADGQGR